MKEAERLLNCLRCDHVWIPRYKVKPKACPKCKSYGYKSKKNKPSKKMFVRWLNLRKGENYYEGRDKSFKLFAV